MLADLHPQILSPEEGTALWFINSLITIKSTTESTGGSFLLVHQLAPPGMSTPYHLHHIEDEAFYVLEGNVTFFSDGERIEAGPSHYLFLPRGRAHGIRVDGPEPASMLIMAMPGSGFAGFLAEMGEPATERVLPPPTPPDMAKMAALCTKFSMDILGPLPD